MYVVALQRVTLDMMTDVRSTQGNIETICGMFLTQNEELHLVFRRRLSILLTTIEIIP